MERTMESQRNEAVNLIKLIQRLNPSEQMGILMMIQGVHMIKGTNVSRPHSELPAPTFEETP